MHTANRISLLTAAVAALQVLFLLNVMVVLPLAMGTAPGSHAWHLDCSCGCDAATVSCCCTEMSDQVEVRGCGTSAEAPAALPGLQALLPIVFTAPVAHPPSGPRFVHGPSPILPDIFRCLDPPPQAALLT